jgi:hypothetical protein
MNLYKHTKQNKKPHYRKVGLYVCFKNIFKAFQNKWKAFFIVQLKK